MTPELQAAAGARKPWRVQLICCGHDDGTVEFDSWSQADEFRASYTDPRSGHDRQAIISSTGEQPGAVITPQVLAELRAGLDRGNPLAFAWAGAHLGHLRGLLAAYDALLAALDPAEQPIGHIPTPRGINYLRDRRQQHPKEPN